MCHAASGCDLVAQGALGAEGQLIFGRLAVDQVARTPRMGRRVISPGAIALLADEEDPPEIALAAFKQRFVSFEHRVDDALGVSGAASPDEFGVLAGGDERRNS